MDLIFPGNRGDAVSWVVPFFSTIALFCSAVYLLLRSTDVMTSTILRRLLSCDYSNNSAAITITKIGLYEVWSKRGLVL